MEQSFAARSPASARGPEVGSAVSAGRREGEEDPLWQVICRHEAAVAWIAREYRHLGVPMEDLLAEGLLGLVEAAVRFDPARGVKFITYAMWWARKRIGETASRQAVLVRLPRYRLRRLARVRAAEHEATAALGRPATTEEIAREAGLTASEVEILLGFCRREVSLSERVSADSALRIEETVASRVESAPDIDLLWEDRASLLSRLLAGLPERQRQVLTWRFGLDGRPSRTLSEIGERLRVSRERVRQVETAAIDRLRKETVEAHRPRRSADPERR